MTATLEHARSAASVARRTQIAQRSDRPRQRRATADPDARPSATVRAMMQIRDADAQHSGVHFTGRASAYEQAYEMWDFFGPYSEIVSAGAGANSLARADLDVPLVLQHDSLRRIARTLNGSLALAETAEGLEVDAPNLDLDDQDVAYIVPKIRAGLITEMSFAFRIVRGQWSPDYTEYRIEEYDIHRGDVAIVGYGANPYTTVGLRQSGTDLITLEETRLIPLWPNLKGGEAPWPAAT